MSGGDWKELFRAACDGDIELLRYHVKNQVDVNYAHPEFLSTPLVACILAGQEASAHLLLDHGANPVLHSEFDGLTPVEAARQVGLVRVEARLREMGAPDPADVQRAGGWLQRVLGDRLPWYLR
jgi:ankyrin repeat protein